MVKSRISTPSAMILCALVVPFNAVAFTIGSPSRNALQFSRTISLQEKREENLDDEDFDDYDEYYDDRRPRRRRGRGRGPPRGDERYDSYDDLGGYYENRREGMNVPSSYGRRDGWRLPESVSKSLLAGIFVLGVGLGVTVDSQINTSPKDLASRDAIDQAAPNAELCATMGASAMAFDQRVFVSFNPFNVYVSQADVKPACVLRQSNVVPILKDNKHLLDDAEVRSCKANMNTWAFVGNLNEKPQLSCVYKSEDAQNEFLSNPIQGIGEDYLDDDRANEMFKKQVKNDMTTSQKAAASAAKSK
ncbi:MAG: hypothetical protein SGBAC_005594 [Bacillariaceae sp.]